jgi:hypothetical protein
MRLSPASHIGAVYQPQESVPAERVKCGSRESPGLIDFVSRRGYGFRDHAIDNIQV